jgi:hypothetical protein
MQSRSRVGHIADFAGIGLLIKPDEAMVFEPARLGGQSSSVHAAVI